MTLTLIVLYDHKNTLPAKFHDLQFFHTDHYQKECEDIPPITNVALNIICVLCNNETALHIPEHLKGQFAKQHRCMCIERAPNIY